MVPYQTPGVGTGRWNYGSLPNSRCGNREVELWFPTKLQVWEQGGGTMVPYQTPGVGTGMWNYGSLPNSRCGYRDVEL